MYKNASNKKLVLKNVITKILKRENLTGLAQWHNKSARIVNKPEGKSIENIQFV